MPTIECLGAGDVVEAGGHAVGEKLIRGALVRVEEVAHGVVVFGSVESMKGDPTGVFGVYALRRCRLG